MRRVNKSCLFSAHGPPRAFIRNLRNIFTILSNLSMNDKIYNMFVKKRGKLQKNVKLLWKLPRRHGLL